MSSLPEPFPALKPTHYLPHLSGLRVLALLGVLLFHFDHATGGFIGVDIFLVLSGFLITRNILRSIATSTFSFHSFYVRRFWRLYPSSFTTAFFAVVAAVLVFPPDLTIAVVTSGLASCGLVSNLHFLHITDYFDDGAHLKPLLHTWSLSLEEQFYLVWPILLYYMTLKIPSKPLQCTLLLSIAALSVTLCYLLNDNHPAFVFFALPTRIFEFTLGTFSALTERYWHLEQPSQPSFIRVIMETLLSIPAVLIILASFFYMPIQPQPHHVLFVLLAAVAFVITPNSMLCKYAFGNRIMQFLGGLTYCAYLTHWPIYVFSRYILDGLRIPRLNVLVLTIATFTTAFLMQVTIENPLRKRRMKYFAPLFISITAFLVFSISIWVAHDHGYTVNQNKPSSGPEVRKECIDYGEGWVSGSYGCETGDLSGPHANVTVIGDSYAGHLIPAFSALGKKKGLKFTFIFFNGCQIRPREYPDQGPKKCWNSQKAIWELLTGKAVKTKGNVVVKPNSRIVVSHWTGKGDLEARNEKIRGVHRDLTELGHEMVLVTAPPGMDMTEWWRHSCNDLRKTAFMRLFQMMGLDLSHNRCVGEMMKPHGHSHAATKEYRETVAKERLDGMLFVDLFKEMCEKVDGGTKCKALWDESWEGIPEPGYRRDGHHMTRSGSLFFVPVFEQYLYD